MTISECIPTELFQTSTGDMKTDSTWSNILCIRVRSSNKKNQTNVPYSESRQEFNDVFALGSNILGKHKNTADKTIRGHNF